MFLLIYTFSLKKEKRKKTKLDRTVFLPININCLMKSFKVILDLQGLILLKKYFHTKFKTYYLNFQKNYFENLKCKWVINKTWFFNQVNDLQLKCINLWVEHEQFSWQYHRQTHISLHLFIPCVLPFFTQKFSLLLIAFVL